MSYWPFTMRRDTKKDERITELEAQVARLTDQNTKIAEANQETERILVSQDVFIAALKADKMRLEQEATERFETITGLRRQLDDVALGDKLISDGYEQLVERQKTDAATIAALNERIRELEHDATEYAVASARYVKDIAELQGECLAIGAENSDLIMFVRKCATGANIRADKPGGAKLVSDARALLKQYDSREVKAQ